MWQRLRKSLRIAVTAVSLLVCGLLIVLWVRSYFCPEAFFIQSTDELLISVYSIPGSAELKLQKPWEGPFRFWSWESLEPSQVKQYRPSQQWKFNAPDPYYDYWLDYYWFRMRTPYWFYATITAAIATVPWIKWRFSLRTLLIVLTLFALFFGAIAMSISMQ